MLPRPPKPLTRRKRKVTARDPFGRESGTWEEETAMTLHPVRPTYGCRRKTPPQAGGLRCYGCRFITGAWRNPSPLPGGTDAAPPEAPGCCARAAHHDR